ncbi:ead/Ea22-like family protein [Escherichia coli]|uniref:ead/Ea22-like family protein n=1 Tax=Escherichia coli TaxID=562 RepID=UPI000DA434B0|nr:ead/Ea22-like family protein [Escherichia coli]MBA8379972.1 ead/Ea22-like family protein [Escherichia coli]MBA8382646.1 ead/Ea22-like family protein [Escherichia coli]QMM71277.1 ead/Ea22-like family protein [Escherichia coli]QMM72992.1 ead/Ea22-like family protein [Escherichia coli]SQT89740.1 prophage protein [Escherichia coli]
MSKIDYQALREAAEKATWGDWDSYKPHRGARGYEVRLSSQAIAQHVLKNNAEFIAAFNPKIALALLDERERNLQYIKRRDQESEEIALTVGKLRVELEAAKKRIAELEAEPVSQAYNLAELIEGMEVSIDVSTCDADLGNRYFGTVTEALELDTAKNGYILLVQDAEPNFDVNGNSPVTPDGWIPVSERMPEPYEYVLVTDGFDGCEVMRVNTDGYWGPAKSLYPGGITHWMPLPEPPQEVNRG